MSPTPSIGYSSYFLWCVFGSSLTLSLCTSGPLPACLPPSNPVCWSLTPSYIPASPPTSLAFPLCLRLPDFPPYPFSLSGNTDNKPLSYFIQHSESASAFWYPWGVHKTSRHVPRSKRLNRRVQYHYHWQKLRKEDSCCDKAEISLNSLLVFLQDCHTVVSYQAKLSLLSRTQWHPVTSETNSSETGGLKCLDLYTFFYPHFSQNSPSQVEPFWEQH